MILSIEPQPSPLRLDEGGAIRVGQTRVTLDTVIETYLEGMTANEIVDCFPALDLADVHATIAYYLRNKDAVDDHLARNRHEADKLREEVERQFDPTKIRAMLLARRAKLESGLT